MAGVGEEEEEVDYESDPEEAKLSLKMRRREASDDEEEEEYEVEDKDVKANPLRRIESDVESEGQGAPADYDEDDDEEEEYELEEEEYAEEYEEVGGVSGGVFEEGVTVADEAVVKDAYGVKEVVGEGIGSGQVIDDGEELDNLQREGEKKENEPFAVPTAGAFYMHDDRFRDNSGGGRHRRTFGGRKLWESRDDRKWGHDKFEELTIDERHYEEDRRATRGRHRGRGRTPGPERGSARGRRPKAFINDSNQSNNNNQKIQYNASKGMRGRGPRRYRPSFKDNIDAPPLNKQSGDSIEKPLRNNFGKASTPVSNVENDAVTTAKQGFVSRLNYASPPFYPSSTPKENTMTHKKELQTRTTSRSLLGVSSTGAQSTAMMRGKDVSDFINGNKLNVDGSITAAARKPSSGLPLAPGSSTMNSTQSQPFRGQGRGFNATHHMNYHVTNNQINRVSQPAQLHSIQVNSVQGLGKPSFQSGQQFVQRSATGSQGSSPPKTGQPIFEPGEVESSSDSSKLKSTMVAKGKGTLQGTGRGSVLYGGAQVMGTPGSMGSGDQNFSARPAFLPVMQFGGQHPGGIGVPAVGMAFPGYVGQPQGGMGNSEMTWLPVLAGAAGALGARYCSPYIAVDGAYHARPSGQISSLTAAPSKENTSSANNDGKPQHRPELTNDEFGQRQRNPRRYTEMKFDQ